MHSLNKYHFEIFIILTVLSQIFLININFIGGPSIKPSQVYFLFLLIMTAGSFLKFKFPRLMVKYTFAIFIIISLVSFFTLFNYDKQFFFHFATNDGYEPFVHILLLTFNLITPILVYFLISTYDLSKNFLETFHNSVFYGCMIFFFIVVSPIDSSFLYKETTEILLRNEIPVRRFIGGVEFSVLCVAAVASLINSASFYKNIYYSTFKLIILLAGLTVGFSRQAVLSLIIAVFLNYIITSKRNFLQSLSLFIITILGVSFVSYYSLLLFIPAIAEVILERIFSIFQIISYSTGTIGDRIQLWGKMIAENSNNILFGQGLDAYLKFFSYRGEGAHNFPIMIFHAGGLVAFISYLYVQFSVILNLLNFVKYNQTAKTLFIILIIFFTSSLSNLIYMTHIFWVFVGISYYFVNKLQS